MGTFYEPKDALNRGTVGADTYGTSSQRFQKKCHYTLPLKALTDMTEDLSHGEATPTNLHGFSWEWPD